MSTTAADLRLSTLDYILAAVDTSQRPSDFGLVFHLKSAPSLDALRAGARSARNCYPVSSSAIEGKSWVPVRVPFDGITSGAFSPKSAEMFLSQRMDLRKDAPIQQLLLTDEGSGKAMLVTHVHHAAADGYSAALWLRHQFKVAADMERPVTKQAALEPVLLRRAMRQPASTAGMHGSDSPGPSQGLWTETPHGTGPKHWMTLELPALAFINRCSAIGVSPADALAAAVFETLAHWNRIHGAATQRIGLWLPVNIRQRRSRRFGNGTSRIRIHINDSMGLPFVDRCREIRRQIQFGLRHGEWAFPENISATRLPFWASGPLLNHYLNRPNVDMGTIAFSYVENWSGCEDPVFQQVEKIECVGQLHERHALAINAVRHDDSIWLTFTYDSSRLTHDNIRQMAESLQL